MVIEYSLPHISFISSYIITNKTLILSIFCKRRSSYVSAKTHTWSERLRLILYSFPKLESFGYNNNNGDFVNQHFLRKRCDAELVIITEVKFIKTFLHTRGENSPWKEMAKDIVNNKENVHG